MKTIREDGANKKAARGFAKFLAIFIILSVAIFGDTMYAIQMQKVFAGNGLLMTFCYIGAFTSVMAVGYLLLGKLTVFEPGGQMWAAWIIFGMELAIIMLNIMVVFNHDKSGPMGTQGFWEYPKVLRNKKRSHFLLYLGKMRISIGK